MLENTSEATLDSHGRFKLKPIVFLQEHLECEEAAKVSGSANRRRENTQSGEQKLITELLARRWKQNHKT